MPSWHQELFISDLFINNYISVSLFLKAEFLRLNCAHSFTYYFGSSYSSPSTGLANGGVQNTCPQELSGGGGGQRDGVNTAM